MTEKKSDFRILEVIDNYFPAVDGVVRVVDNYGKLLNEKAECVVLAPYYPRHPESDKYTLVCCKSVSGGKFGVRLPLPALDISLKKYLKNNRFDIIHCHSPVTLARFIVKYAEKNNIPLVFTVHSKYHEEINYWVKWKFLQKRLLDFLLSTIKKMDYIWSVSEGSRKVLTDMYGIKRDCKVMRNGCDIDMSELPSPDKTAELRQKLNLSDDCFTLLFVGRLVHAKNVDLLLSAIGILANTDLNFKLVIVGGGEYRAALEKQVRSLHVGDKVLFSGEVTDRAELITYYSAADLFVLPSTYDTSSLSIKESFALSVPALVVEGSASSEGIIDKHNSFTACDTPEAFAEKLEYIIRNKNILPEIKENCHKELYVPWSSLIDDVYAEYRRIAATGKIIK